MQTYELLQPEFGLTGYAARKHYFDTSDIGFPIRYLHQPREGGLGIPKWHGLCNLVARRLVGSEDRLLGLEAALAGFDLIHAVETYHFFSQQAVAAKQRYGCPMVVTVWENVPFAQEERPDLAAIKQTVRQGADLLLAVTEQARAALLLEGVPAERVRVIGAGVDIERFQPGPPESGLRERYGVQPGEQVVLFVGSLLWAKGVYDLVLAARHLLADDRLRNRAVRLLLVGQGPELEGLRRMVGRLGLERSVTFAGNVSYSEMPAVHRLADVFVLPSISTPTWQEQFGMVLVEAMATGKAVVASHSGAIPEVVGDAGILAPPADSYALADAIKDLLLDDKRREELGRRARQRVEQHYDRKLVAGRITQAYKELLTTSRSAGRGQ
jgi:glycosyltransferase involved in cell wall biosynthesis